MINCENTCNSNDILHTTAKYPNIYKKKTHRNKKMSSKRNVEKYMTKLFAHKHKI